MMKISKLDERAIKVAKALVADAVDNAGSGHPGTAISLMPISYLLYQKVMKHNPKNPKWLGRDKLVLSAGHASLLQYVQLFMSGYKVSLNDIKALRAFGSKTPAHPEIEATEGVEVSTGPLGSGLATAVGLSMANRYEKGLFDPKTPTEKSIFSNNIFVIAGEGDIQEGIANEASSIAGTQKLGNLIVLFDKNKISIEGSTDIAFTENVLEKYKALGWDTSSVSFITKNGYNENLDEVYKKIERAKKITDKPSIIQLETIIAYPSPTKKNTAGVHGSKLGDDETRALKKELGLSESKKFFVCQRAFKHSTSNAISNGESQEKEWNIKFNKWAKENPEKNKLLKRLLAKQLPNGIEKILPKFIDDVSTRVASGKVLTALKDEMVELWGGSADLAGSNNTSMAGEPSFLPFKNMKSGSWEEKATTANGAKKDNPYGRTIHFGIREHAMAAISNGINLGLTRNYCGTFFVFSDYMRGAVRLSALMNLPSIFVWSHDSIGVGEDGPTHQPVEHLASFRAMPNFCVVRPSDGNETSACYLEILKNRKPTGLILSRQNLKTVDRNKYSNANNARKGAYNLVDEKGAKAIIFASGSEVEIALEAHDKLLKKGIKTNVVSVPCFEWFFAQSKKYIDSILIPTIKNRVSIEAGSTMGWSNFVGEKGVALGIDNAFGKSGAPDKLYKYFGLTADNVVKQVMKGL